MCRVVYSHHNRSVDEGLATLSVGVLQSADDTVAPIMLQGAGDAVVIAGRACVQFDTKGGVNVATEETTAELLGNITDVVAMGLQPSTSFVRYFCNSYLQRT